MRSPESRQLELVAVHQADVPAHFHEPQPAASRDDRLQYQSLQYRREIDGLRAMAVLPVVFFHAGFNAFHGGFVGVDIFFVISGYLITSVVLRDIQAGTFSVAGFYERRARRILPALYVVMLASIPFAWLWMLPDYLENYGESLFATTVFANNVLLYLTSGYWDLAAEFKPLLHTWSLGVEEQFYVVFPLVLLLGWRLGPRWLLGMLSATALVSILVAGFVSTADPEASFLFLHTRAWELMVGALCALYLARRSLVGSEWASVLGLAAIATAVLGFEQDSMSGLPRALGAVLGTASMVLFCTPATVVGRILSSRALVLLGLCSYSVYLWHLPLFAYARLLSLEEPTSWTFAMLILVALVLAYLTWRFVETRFRDRAAVSARSLVILGAGVGIAIAAIGLAFYLTSGFVHRWSELDSGMTAAGRRLNAVYNERPFELRNRAFADPLKRHVLIFGNSRARDFINAALESGYMSRAEISYVVDEPQCIQQNGVDARTAALLRQADDVILASGIVELSCWPVDAEDLHKLGAKRVIVIGPKNFGRNMNAVMRLAAVDRYSYRAAVLEEIRAINDQQSVALTSSSYVDVIRMLGGPAGATIPVFTPDRKLISQDGQHLTRDGARYVGSVIFRSPLLVGLQ